MDHKELTVTKRQRLTEALHWPTNAVTYRKAVTHIKTDRQSNVQKTAWRSVTEFTDQDFVLSGEIWWFTEQLCVRDSERTRCLSNQHSVIESGSTRCRWHKVTPLQQRNKRMSIQPLENIHNLYYCSHVVQLFYVLRNTQHIPYSTVTGNKNKNKLFTQPRDFSLSSLWDQSQRVAYLFC